MFLYISKLYIPIIVTRYPEVNPTVLGPSELQRSDKFLLAGLGNKTTRRNGPEMTAQVYKIKTIRDGPTIFVGA